MESIKILKLQQSKLISNQCLNVVVVVVFNGYDATHLSFRPFCPDFMCTCNGKRDNTLVQMVSDDSFRSVN